MTRRSAVFWEDVSRQLICSPADERAVEVCGLPICWCSGVGYLVWLPGYPTLTETMIHGTGIWWFFKGRKGKPLQFPAH